MERGAKLSKIYILLLLLFTIPLVYAEVNTNKAADWLANFTNFDQDIETVSLSILALSLADKAGDAQQGLARLIDRQDAAGCWPKGNCRVKDTGLAVLALSQFGRPTSTARSWLISSRLPASTTGKFWIQVAASVDGQCRVLYDGKSKTFTLKNGNIVECSNKPWIEASCIDANLLRSSVEKTIDVDCSTLQGSSIISLIFQQGDSYYILDEQHTNIAKLKIANACLGSAKTSTSCDYDATLWATFAMRSLGQDIGTLTYLESNIQANNIVGYSLLYALTKKDVYREILASKQLASGSFSNVYQTGLAMIALQSTTAGSNASAWLELQQSQDGSFNRNVRDTSSVVYGLLFEDFSSIGETCIGSGNFCCSACSQDGEDFKSLDSSCNLGQVCCSECSDVVVSTCSELGGIECGFNERCIGGSLQEAKDTISCCVDGTCQERETTVTSILPSCNFDNICDVDETIDSCPEDCKKSNVFLWVIVVVLAVLIGGGLFYLAKKKPGLFKFRKREKPELRQPAQRPAYPVFQPRARQQVQQPSKITRKKQLKSKVEEELEKSLAEAKKLLKGEKK